MFDQIHFVHFLMEKNWLIHIELTIDLRICTLYCICLCRCCFWVIIKISTHPCYPRNWQIFKGMKQKKNNNVQWKQTEIFKPWVDRIDWWKLHKCGSTYMVERLSHVSSKTGKNAFLCVFRLFLSSHWTASQP